MQFTIQGRTIHTFAITPRTLELDEYWQQIDFVGSQCAKHGFTGSLLFNGNDTFVEVFACAQSLIERYGISPLIAVNPEYMHPFTVAKFVSSYAYVFKQKVYLNMITGTALSQARAMSCALDHDQKYDRLLEYTHIIQELTRKSNRPITFSGNYYQVDDLKLNTPIPEELLPGYFIAGHSPAAMKVRDRSGAVGMKMLDSSLAESVAGDRGIHFGVVCRDTTEEAWEAANEKFPEDRRGQHMLRHSMKNTDSAWKKRLHYAADIEDKCANGYWLAPFRNFQADCPYFVSSREDLKRLIVDLIHAGVDEFILDIPPDETDFAQCAKAFDEARNELLRPLEEPHASVDSTALHA